MKKYILISLMVLMFFLSGCQAPVANDDNVTLASGQTKIIDILSNDKDSDGVIDATSVTIVTDVKEGNTTVDAVTGEVTYVSNEDYVGMDTFIYTVKDRQGIVSNSATVFIKVITGRKFKKSEEEKPSNWYIRLVAEDSARALKTVSSQLGELEEENTVTRHTLKALRPFGANYIDIIFRNPSGVSNGDYKVNFHKYDEDTEGLWSFTVRADDDSADILLSWQGIYILTPYTDEQNRKRYSEYISVSNPLFKHMKLIDSSNGKEVAAVLDGKLQKYQFNMDGQTERNFEWAVQKEEVKLLTPLNKYPTLKINKKILKKKIDIFDLNKPPSIEENGK